MKNTAGQLHAARQCFFTGEVFPFYQIPQIAQQSSASVHKGGGRCAILVSESPVVKGFVSMSQAAAQQPSRKKTVLSLLVLLALT